MKHPAALFPPEHRGKLTSIVRGRAVLRYRQFKAARLSLDDLEQVGWAGAWRSYQRYQPGQGYSLLAWVAFQVDKAILDQIRAETHYRTRPIPLLYSLSECDKMGLRDPARDDGLRALVEQLPPDRAFLIRGHFLEGRLVAELAAELGMSPALAHYHKNEALRTLRRALRRERRAAEGTG